VLRALVPGYRGQFPGGSRRFRGTVASTLFYPWYRGTFPALYHPLAVVRGPSPRLGSGVTGHFARVLPSCARGMGAITPDAARAGSGVTGHLPGRSAPGSRGRSRRPGSAAGSPAATIPPATAATPATGQQGPITRET